MKTNKQHLENLEEPYKTQALNNVVEQGTVELIEEVKEVSISQALLGSFEWGKTPEGHNYWCNKFLELGGAFQPQSY